MWFVMLIGCPFVFDDPRVGGPTAQGSGGTGVVQQPPPTADTMGTTDSPTGHTGLTTSNTAESGVVRTGDTGTRETGGSTYPTGTTGQTGSTGLTGSTGSTGGPMTGDTSATHTGNTGGTGVSGTGTGGTGSVTPTGETGMSATGDTAADLDPIGLEVLTDGRLKISLRNCSGGVESTTVTYESDRAPTTVDTDCVANERVITMDPEWGFCDEQIEVVVGAEPSVWVDIPTLDLTTAGQPSILDATVEQLPVQICINAEAHDPATSEQFTLRGLPGSYFLGVFMKDRVPAGTDAEVGWSGTTHVFDRALPMSMLSLTPGPDVVFTTGPSMGGKRDMTIVVSE